MKNKILVAAILGLLAGLITGFTVANSINRTEINTLRGQVEQGKKPGVNSQSPGDAFSIADDEIKAKLAEADANPENFTYQKNLGAALYRYATMKNDAALLVDALRILTRANSLDGSDYEVTVDLGNALFDSGYLKKDVASIKKSRDLYIKALEVKPTDADVRSDLAMTFVLDTPPDYNRAVEEFQKALKSNPKKERALTFLTQTYMQLGNWAEAQKTLDLLKASFPKNDKISDLTSQIAAKKAAPIQ